MSALNARKLLAHNGCDFGAEQLDGTQQLAMRYCANINVQEEAIDAQIFAQKHNLLGYIFNIADIQRASEASSRIERFPVIPWPAALAPDNIHLGLNGWEDKVGGVLSRIRYETV